MPGRIYELPVHPGPFPWTHILPSDSEANGSFGFSHKSLAENYTGDFRVLPAVTALTGGGTALDGVATAGGATATGAVREVLLGRTVYRYQLVNGADAEGVPDVIRPDDYNAGSNNRVWRLLRASSALQLNSVPGFSTNADVALPGLTLGASQWTLWTRVFVSSSLTLRLAPASGANLRLSVEVPAATAGNSLTLTLNDNSGAALVTATLADFRSRYGGSLVDLMVVRRASPVAETHVLAVYANGDLLVEANVSATAAVASEVAQVAVGLDGVAVRWALFRYAMTPANLHQLMVNGIGAPDRWGRVAAGYTANFSAGTDSWVAVGGGAVAGNIDGVGIPSRDNVLRYTVPATPAAEQAVRRSFNVASLSNRRVRATGSVWLPTSNAGADQVVLYAFSLPSFTPIVLAGKTAGWVDFAVEFIMPSSLASLAFGLTFAAGSGTQQAGDLLYVSGLEITPVGALFDINCGVGAGRFLPDHSPNGYNGSITPSNFQHTRPLSSGQLTLVQTLAHDAISATAGTTVLGYLPPNAAVMRVEFERLAAFDAAVTLDVGITGTPGRYVSGQAVDATGNVLAASAVQTTESATAPTTLFIRKSGATTVGSVRVKLVYEIRGNSAADT